MSTAGSKRVNIVPERRHRARGRDLPAGVCRRRLPGARRSRDEKCFPLPGHDSQAAANSIRNDRQKVPRRQACGSRQNSRRDAAARPATGRRGRVRERPRPRGMADSMSAGGPPTACGCQESQNCNRCRTDYGSAWVGGGGIPQRDRVPILQVVIRFQDH